MGLRRGKLLTTALTALALLLGANLAVDRLGIKYWRPDELRWRQNLYAYQRLGIETDVLVLGSSRSLFGVTSRVLESELATAGLDRSVYNLGQPRGDALRNAIVLGDVVRSNPCPEAILFEISPSLLAPTKRELEFVSEYASFRDVALLRPFADDARTDLDAYLAGSFAGAVGLYYHLFEPPDLDRMRCSAERRGSRWGREPPATYESVGPERLRRIEARPRRGRKQRRSLAALEGGDPLAPLERIARLAEGCDASLFLVRIPPVYEPDSPLRDRVERKFEALMAELRDRTGVPYFAISRAALGLEPRHYRDVSHLNPIGAEILTAHLAREILIPALERDRGWLRRRSGSAAERREPRS